MLWWSRCFIFTIVLLEWCHCTVSPSSFERSHVLPCALINTVFVLGPRHLVWVFCLWTLLTPKHSNGELVSWGNSLQNVHCSPLWELGEWLEHFFLFRKDSKQLGDGVSQLVFCLVVLNTKLRCNRSCLFWRLG